MNQRIKSIDNLRGIAAFMVVLYHFGLKFYKAESIFYLGSYGVHIFFVISGFVIIISVEGSRKGILNAFRFLAKRVVRIDPPYVATIVLVLLYSFFITFRHPDITFILEIERFYLHLAYLIPFSDYTWYSPVFWTLGVEFQFYLIVAFLYFCPVKYPREMLIGLLIIFGVFDLFVPISNGQFFILRYAGFFIAGVATSAYFIKKIKYFIFWVLIITSMILSYLALEDGIVGSIVLLMTVVSILFIRFQHGIFDFFAKISYSLYLIHYTLMHLFYQVFSLYFKSLINKELMFVLSIVLTVLCSYLFCLLIERPAMALSKKIILLKTDSSS